MRSGRQELDVTSWNEVTSSENVSQVRIDLGHVRSSRGCWLATVLNVLQCLKVFVLFDWHFAMYFNDITPLVAHCIQAIFSSS